MLERHQETLVEARASPHLTAKTSRPRLISRSKLLRGASELLETSRRSTSIDASPRSALASAPTECRAAPEKALSQTGTSEVPVFSCFEAGCSALFERLPDQVEDKLLIMIACNTAFPTDAGSFPVKRNTLAVSREVALHRKR